MMCFSCLIFPLLLGLLGGMVLFWLLGAWSRPGENVDQGGCATAITPVSPHNCCELQYGWFDQASAEDAIGRKIKGLNDLDALYGCSNEILATLRARNFRSLSDIADVEPDKLIEILKGAGCAYEEAVVGSFQEQAQYIIENRWDELKSMRKRLLPEQQISFETSDSSK